MKHTELLADLKEKGHRLTPQREMILAAICDQGGHLTADAILQRVHKRYSYLNKSAVYRTLDLLTQLNLVDQIDCGHGQIEYEIHQHPHHHHLLCRRCGKIVEIDGSVFTSIEKTLREKYDFLADLDHFAIFGLCRKCQADHRRQTTDAKPQKSTRVKSVV